METKQIRYCSEDMVSRLPGLFPYFEFAENGVTIVHSAKDSMDGCYGKVVCGIKLPDDAGLTVGGNQLLNGGESYSYRTLMNMYYTYRDVVPSSDRFRLFLEKCIGRYRIYDEIDMPECDLIPEYGYYAESARLFAEYRAMSEAVALYQTMKQDMDEINCEMECLVEKYARMGGDVMRDYYRDKSYACTEIADDIFVNHADASAAVIGLSLNMVSTENDLGYLSTYLDYWEPSKRYVGGDIVIYNDRTYVCTCAQGTYTEGAWDSGTETVVFDYGNFALLSDGNPGTEDGVTLSGTMESMLPEFKEGKLFTDEGGSVRTPNPGEDWLWYYKKGAVGHSESFNDEYGNIMMQEGYERNLELETYETHLMAYGDVLTDIIFDEESFTVTFEYVIGCNLKAVLRSIATDGNGVTRYYYSGYEYNQDDAHGVRCTETYKFCGDLSAINEIVGNGDFDSFVNGNMVGYWYHRCPFSLEPSIETIQMIVNGVPAYGTAVMTNFIVSVGSERDELVSPVMKMDYLTGVSMKPDVDSEVYVNRGNAAAWERHVKLGDVRTFNGLLDFSNGGFFNLI